MFSVLSAFQSDLVGHVRSDTALVAALGGTNIFDSVPKNGTPPFVVIERLDARQLDGQLTKLIRAEIDWAIWLNETHRKNAFEIAEVLDAALETANPTSADLKLISYVSKRTQSRIDRKTGWTKVLLSSLFSIEKLN